MSYISLVRYVPNASQTNPKPHHDWKKQVLSQIIKSQDTANPGLKKKILIQAILPWINTWMHPKSPKDPNNKNLTWVDTPPDITFEAKELQTQDQLTGMLTPEQIQKLHQKNALDDYMQGLRTILNTPNESAYTRVGKATQFILSFCKQVNEPENETHILFNRGLRRWMKNTLRALTMDEFVHMPPMQRDPLGTMQDLHHRWSLMTTLPFEYANDQKIPRKATRLQEQAGQYAQSISTDDAIELVQVRKKFYETLNPYEMLLMDPAYGAMPNRAVGVLGTKQAMISSVFIDMISQPATNENVTHWSIVGSEHYTRHRSSAYDAAMQTIEKRTQETLQWSSGKNLHWWINTNEYQESSVRLANIPSLNYAQAYTDLIQKYPFLHKHPEQSQPMKLISQGVKMEPSHDLYHAMMNQTFPIKGSTVEEIIDMHRRLLARPANAIEVTPIMSDALNGYSYT